MLNWHHHWVEATLAGRLLIVSRTAVHDLNRSNTRWKNKSPADVGSALA